MSMRSNLADMSKEVLRREASYTSEVCRLSSPRLWLELDSRVATNPFTVLAHKVIRLDS